MTTDINTPLLPYRITICGLDELAGHAQSGFSHVVSILDPERADPEDFTVYAPHRRVLWRFDDTVEQRAGFTPPAERDVRKILTLGEELLNLWMPGKFLGVAIADSLLAGITRGLFEIKGQDGSQVFLAVAVYHCLADVAIRFEQIFDVLWGNILAT